MPKPKRPRGSIHRLQARELLTEYLGVDPRDDIGITVWRDQRLLLQDDVDHKVNGARGGALNPVWYGPLPLRQKPPPIRLPLPSTGGRPNEVEMDRLNAMLLKEHPSLAKAPLYFAMLEAYFHLDHFEAVRFSPPRVVAQSPAFAWQQRRAVCDRARERIRRALAFQEPQPASTAA